MIHGILPKSYWTRLGGTLGPVCFKMNHEVVGTGTRLDVKKGRHAEVPPRLAMSLSLQSCAFAEVIVFTCFVSEEYVFRYIYLYNIWCPPLSIGLLLIELLFLARNCG